MKDAAFRAWVREQPCLLRGRVDREGVPHQCVGTADPAHVVTYGHSRRDVRNIVPLCRLAHLEQEGRTREFEVRYDLDLRAIADEVFSQYDRDRARQLPF